MRLTKSVILAFLVFITFVVFSNFIFVQTAVLAEDEPKRGSLDWSINEKEGIIRLDTEDPSYNSWNDIRDTSKDPKREPGPIHLNRQTGGASHLGIPTFYRSPVAINPADLKAGDVDAAFLGMPFDFTAGVNGTGLGPQAVRAAEYLRPWRVGSASIEHADTMIDPLDVLNVVDYGDVSIEFLSLERTLKAAIPVVREAAKTGTVLFVAGGDHAVPYAVVRGMVEAHGKGSVGVIHFDAHQDVAPYGYGHPVHYGTWIRSLVDDGLVDGKNIIQVGNRGFINSKGGLEFQRQMGIKTYYMVDIRKRGMDAVMKDAMADALNGPDKLYISVDLDFFDASSTPGTTAPEHGGPMPGEFFPHLRALFIQNDVVGMDIIEVNPLVDNRQRTTMVLASRILLEGMTGLALKKLGIKDPYYIYPGLVKE